MNSENIDMEKNLDLILEQISYLGSQNTPEHNTSVTIVLPEDRNKSRSCKQFDSLNYSLEMHKVRKNKKADFNIHNVNEHNRGIVQLQNLDYVEVYIPPNTGRIVNPTLFAMSHI